jgi:hypothetical protein
MTNNDTTHEQRYRDQEAILEELMKGVEEGVIAAELIKELQDYLKSLGISEDELLVIKDSDPPEVVARKKKLKQMLGILADLQKKLEKAEEENSLSGQQRKAMKKVEEDIKRFLEFDHNRDHDGRLNSLGETGKSISTFERPIADALAVAAALKAGKHAFGELKQQVGEKLGELRDKLMHKAAEFAIEQSVNYVAMQTGIDPSLVKGAMRLTAENLKEQEAQKEQNPEQAKQQMQEKATQALIQDVSQVSPPGATPGWAQHVQDQGKGGERGI